MATKILLPKNYGVLDLGTLKGTIENPVEVSFEAEKEVVAEHLVAKGLSELVPLLNDNECHFSPATGEKIAVIAEEEAVEPILTKPADTPKKKKGE